MAEHNDFGRLAEDLAAEFLAKKNYKILAETFAIKKRKSISLPNLKESSSSPK
ncbi:MAG: hypothetical protein ACXWCF_01275 [Kaistella sp.]